MNVAKHYLKINEFKTNENGFYIYKSNDETHRINLAAILEDFVEFCKEKEKKLNCQRIMENRNIIEGNSAIAEFMGYTYYPWNHPDLIKESGRGDCGWKKHVDASQFSKFNSMKNLPVNSYLCRNNNGLKYHESYDWLIPVAKKIIGIDSDMSRDVMDEFQTNILNIEASWLIIVLFVKWYEKNK